MQIDSEISGVKTETRREQEESEKLTTKLNALQREIEMVQQSNKREEDEKKKLSEQFTML
jgi:chromosome segregation ATPase